ncbi:MAG TPA: twin-arginine translocation signal domain-containing protein, partial [Gemmatimonadaceae bacterium]
MSTRRSFLRNSAAIAASLGLTPLLDRALGAQPLADLGEFGTGKAAASLNILILGGTGFTGP